jgi:CO/xanthine dehydrogenase FAD-binding subunit
MQAFEYANPATVREAVGMLGARWGEVDVLAGGTDLLSLMKEHIETPQRVVNIKNIKELGGIKKHGAEVRIGAAVTLDELERNPDIRRFYRCWRKRRAASRARKSATWERWPATCASGRAAGITATASACWARIKTANR